VAYSSAAGFGARIGLITNSSGPVVSVVISVMSTRTVNSR
jgi:hypothetical protein